ADYVIRARLERGVTLSEPGERLATRYLPGLTGLRGVGAIWVMVFHIQYGRDIPILDSGFLGVDLFFILSGFVLSHTYGAMRFRGTEYALFIRDRVARIFPLHWAALAILGVVLLIFPEIYHSMAARFRSPELIANILLVQNWGFTRPGTWNIPAWSLSTEWLVSLAFPLFLLGARRFTRPVACVLGCAVCLGLLAAFLHATGNPNPNVQSRAAIIRTVLEFATGCL